MIYKVEQIPTEQIKFFVRRSRRARGYARLKQSIQDVGLKVPIGVRDISNRPRRERRRPGKGGANYEYELVYGQGRLQAFRELRIKTIPAVVIDIGEEEIVGRFLAENMMRRRLSWREKAELIRCDFENDLDIDDIAKRYCITQTHAMKYLNILTGASDKMLARATENGFSLAETEKLTTLPPKDQDIVIDFMDEEGLDKSAIKDLVNRATKLRTIGKLTKGTLKESLQALNEELRKCRDRLKLGRLEYALGPQHLFRLAEDEVFVAKADAAGIDLSDFRKEQSL